MLCTYQATLSIYDTQDQLITSLTTVTFPTRSQAHEYCETLCDLMQDMHQYPRHTEIELDMYSYDDEGYSVDHKTMAF